MADETVYGTAVAPTDFFEIGSESVNPSYERIESAGIRGPVLRADRFAPNPKGAAGDFQCDVLDMGFDFWLPHMFGSVTSTGDGSTTPIVATATPGTLAGTSFSLQVARYGSVADALIPFTYSGGKVASWELSAEVDGILQGKLTCDFSTETVNGAGAGDTLATPTYPVGAQIMTFIGGVCEIGGTAFPVSSVSVTGDNGLKVDRYSMRGDNSTTKREPLQASLQSLAFSLTGEFESDAQSKLVAGLLASDVLATLSLTFDSPQGGTVGITAPAARFDSAPANASRDLADQQIDGMLLAPETGDAIKVVYTSVLAA